MLATVSIRQWSAKKADKKATKDVHERNNARSDAGSYRKALVAKAAIEEIQSIAGEARQVHYELTSPWLDNGARILPAYYSENYVSLLPGEERSITIEFAADAAKPSIALRGWNLPAKTIEVQ